MVPNTTAVSHFPLPAAAPRGLQGSIALDPAAQQIVPGPQGAAVLPPHQIPGTSVHSGRSAIRAADEPPQAHVDHRQTFAEGMRRYAHDNAGQIHSVRHSLESGDESLGYRWRNAETKTLECISSNDTLSAPARQLLQAELDRRAELVQNPTEQHEHFLRYIARHSGDRLLVEVAEKELRRREDVEVLRDMERAIVGSVMRPVPDPGIASLDGAELERLFNAPASEVTTQKRTAVYGEISRRNAVFIEDMGGGHRLRPNVREYVEKNVRHVRKLADFLRSPARSGSVHELQAAVSQQPSEALEFLVSHSSTGLHAKQAIEQELGVRREWSAQLTDFDDEHLRALLGSANEAEKELAGKELKRRSEVAMARHNAAATLHPWRRSSDDELKAFAEAPTVEASTAQRILASGELWRREIERDQQFNAGFPEELQVARPSDRRDLRRALVQVQAQPAPYLRVALLQQLPEASLRLLQQHSAVDADLKLAIEQLLNGFLPQ